MNTELHQIITDHLGVNPHEVNPDATLESLGADSLDKIELVMAVEQAFKIEISDTVAEGWVKVSDIEASIETALAGRQ